MRKKARRATPAAKKPITPDDPRVQERVAEKRAAAAREAEATARRAFATAEEIGGHTFHPPNSQTFDAVCHPDILKLSQTRFLVVLAYLLTLPPSRQIAAAADVVALRNAAAEWQDTIATEHQAAVFELTQRANAWVQARLAGETLGFFFVT